MVETLAASPMILATSTTSFSALEREACLSRWTVGAVGRDLRISALATTMCWITL